MVAPIGAVDSRYLHFATDRQKELLEAVNLYGSLRSAAQQLGVNYTVVRQAVESVKNKAALAGKLGRDIAQEIEIAPAPDADEPIEDLIARKMKTHQRLQKVEQYQDLINIDIKHGGPVVVVAIGDPHVDDDLCDIGQLMRDMELIGRTKGMHALHLGDITNNWVGRLGKLYAHQSTKASDGIRLAKHMFKLASPLAVVGGNHDLWNEGMNWLNFVAKQAGCQIVQEHGVRLALNFPDGNMLRIHARHDFPGHSQYNPTHSHQRQHAFGKRDHITIAGHKHIDAMAATPSPEGFVHWQFRVSGYKGFDDYAKQIGVQKAKIAPSVALLLRPDHRNIGEVVKQFYDLEEAANYLTFLRRKERA
jgi:hypothetical protein